MIAWEVQEGKAMDVRVTIDDELARLCSWTVGTVSARVDTLLFTSAN